jgi:hypothetical protein
MIFADCFWKDAVVITSASARQIGAHDDVAMSAIQTSLTALQEGSALAANLPYIAPIAGVLLQVLTMRDVRVTLISF